MTTPGFLSAWGCCARCGKVVSCRARTVDEAVGSTPYAHKWRRGPDGGWCDGHRYPALHYSESDEFDKVGQIDELERWTRVKRRTAGGAPSESEP